MIPSTDKKNITAIVHYEGRLLDGSVFDSSRKRGKPFEFPLGKRHVILGWDKGVATMAKGETCLLTCQPDYAYGNSAVGPIPAKSVLVFEVELLGWREDDGSVNLPKLDQLLNLLILIAIIIAISGAAYIHFFHRAPK